MAAQPWISNGVASGLHTRLLGFVKTALLQQLVPPNSVVCDLFCGRGLDTERWAEAEIGRYVGVDLSASALEEAREQWEQHGKPFPAEFCELDPCMVDLEAQLRGKDLPADIVCCLAHLQDSFTSEDRVRHLLKNVEAVLKPGGFFFGTAPDSSTIWYKYQKAVEGAMKAGSLRVNGTLPPVRTDHYKISFDDDRFHAFGSKYHMRFGDDGLPAQPQLLVHFPSLIRLSREVGLECVEIQNLCEFYDDYGGQFADVLRTCCASLVDLKGVPVLDAKGRLNSQAVDVLSLYTTFIFKKADSSTPNFQVSRTFEHETKAPRSAAECPPRHVENTLSYNMNDDLVGVKVEEHNQLIKTNATMSDGQHHQDPDVHKYETPLGEVSDVGAVHDQQALKEPSAIQKRGEGEDESEQLRCGSEEYWTKSGTSNQPNEEFHIFVKHKLQLDAEPRSKQELSLGARISSSEREDPHLPTSASGPASGREPVQPTSSTGSVLGLSYPTKIDSEEELLPVDHSTQHNLPTITLRLNESSRAERSHKHPPGEHSPRHLSHSYNIYESSNESEKYREYPLGDNNLKHSPQKTSDSRGEVCDAKQQEPQLADTPRHLHQRRCDTTDLSHKQQEASSVSLSSKYYEGRTFDSSNEIDRKRQQEPFFAEWRAHESEDEYAKSVKEQSADQNSRRHSRRSIEFRSKQH